jgi:hypothetical protein
MSGGRFDYKQFDIQYIIDEIEQELSDYPELYSDETKAVFRKGMKLLAVAAIYAHRIDYLICSDDSEERFHERLKEDLNDLKLK